MNILAFLLLSAFAAPAAFELKVESTKLNYSISMSNSNFAYQSETKKIQQPIKPCGKRSYDLFAQKIKAGIKKDLTGGKVKTPKAIQVTLNKEKFYFPPLSSAGVLISKVETDVDYLMSEAAYRCSKK